VAGKRSALSPLRAVVGSLPAAGKGGMTPLEKILFAAKPDPPGRQMASLPLRDGVRLFAVFGESAFVEVYVQIETPPVALTGRLLRWRDFAALEGWRNA